MLIDHPCEWDSPFTTPCSITEADVDLIPPDWVPVTEMQADAILKNSAFGMNYESGRFGNRVCGRLKHTPHSPPPLPVPKTRSQAEFLARIELTLPTPQTEEDIVGKSWDGKIFCIFKGETLYWDRKFIPQFILKQIKA